MTLLPELFTKPTLTASAKFANLDYYTVSDTEDFGGNVTNHINRSARRSKATLAACLFAVVLTAGACSDSDSDESSTPTTAGASSGSTVPGSVTAQSSLVGFLVSADNNEVVLRLADNTERRFAVKPSDLEALDVKHLASHSGVTDVAFKAAYVSENGTDYIKSAAETKPPKK